MANYYVDLVNGSDSNPGTSPSAPAQSFGHLGSTLTGVNTVHVIGDDGPISLGVNGTWTDGSANVTFAASTITKTVTQCETAWTVNPSIASILVCSTSSTRREGSSSASFVSNGGTISGPHLLAYFPLGSAIDFSAFTSLTFWLRDPANMPGNSLKLSLCSDAAGATSVSDFVITQGATTSSWYPMTITGTSPSSTTSIQSIALYSLVTINNSPSLDMFLDNIEATNGVGFNTLISKNNGTDTWFAIKSIVGNTGTVTLDSNPANNTVALSGGYASDTSSETVLTYYRPTIANPSPSSGIYQTIPSGWIGVIMEGGYQTGFLTQNGQTWIDGVCGLGTGLFVNGNIASEFINFTRWDNNLLTNTSGARVSIGSGGLASNNALGANIEVAANTYFNGTVIGCIGSSSDAFTLDFNSITNDLIIKNCDSNASRGFVCNTDSPISSLSITARRNGSNPLSFNGHGSGRINNLTANNNALGVVMNNIGKVVIDNLVMNNNGAVGCQLSGAASVTINGGSSSGHSQCAFLVNPSSIPNMEIDHYLNNFTMSETPALPTASVLSKHIQIYNPTGQRNQTVYSQNESGVLGNNVIYTDGAYVTTAADVTFPQALDWIITLYGPTGLGVRDSTHPVRLKIPAAFFKGGSPVNFSGYFTMDSQMGASFYTLANAIPGVGSDTIQSINTFPSYPTLAQYTLTFTPSQQGAADVWIDAWQVSGGSYPMSMFFTNFAISQ